MGDPENLRMKSTFVSLLTFSQAVPELGIAQRRYDQFESMASAFDRKFDKRVITKYGCNCPHLGDRPLSDPGKGAPVDELDRVCLTFKQCTKCAKQQFGEDCISEFNRYAFSETVKKNKVTVTCEDRKGSCNRGMLRKLLSWLLSIDLKVPYSGHLNQQIFKNAKILAIFDTVKNPVRATFIPYLNIFDSDNSIDYCIFPHKNYF